MKKNSGVTLVSLVMTIVILLIIAGIATYSGVGTLKEANYKKFVSELKLMQTYANSIYEELKPNDSEENYDTVFDANISKKFQDLNIVVQKANASTEALQAINDTNYNDYYILDVQEKKALKIEGIEQKILLNIKQRKVVSYEGFEKDGKMIYIIDEDEGIYNVEYTKKTVSLTGITLEQANVLMGQNETYLIRTTVTPQNVTEDLIYETSNPSVATVDNQGLVTAIAKGKATITVRGRATTNKKAFCNITVVNSMQIGTLDAENYGQYIDLGTDVLGTGSFEDNWKILYSDSQNNVVYVILADYLANSNNVAQGAGLLKATGEYSTYGVNSTSKANLLSGIQNQTGWKSLISSSLPSFSSINVYGGPTEDIIRASYNEKYNDTLDLSIYSYLYKNASLEFDELYVRQQKNNCIGYWLANEFSNSAENTNIWCIKSTGNFDTVSFEEQNIGVRPVVILPSNILVYKNENNVWKFR